MTGAAAPVATLRPDNLAATALFGAMLAAAGLPIYLNAPKFYLDSFGVSLGSMGVVLFALRLFDVVQDPALGRLAERLRHWRGLSVAVAAGVMALAMLGLFAVTPPVAPLLWFALMLAILFTSYSYLGIVFYAQGVQKAEAMGRQGYLRLATWREAGGLVGVCVAAVAPTVLAQQTGAPFAALAVGFCGLVVVATLAMRGEWAAAPVARASGFRAVLDDRTARRLLLIALVNGAPVAVTSTLFLFFVESRLQAPGTEGPLLLLFFLSAALSTPLWGRAAQRFGAKTALLAGMGLAVLAFAGAALLGPGDLLWFALICCASGAALGADMTLLPALFAARMARVAPDAGEAFGLWSLVSKFTLAFAAVLLLPLLDASGFVAGGASPPAALAVLTVSYAVVPCGLKLLAIGLLALTDLRES